MMTDLKITGVEAIYLRLPDVKSQCDSGQDALIVKVTTNAGITGYGEVDSNPMAVKGCIEGLFAYDGDRVGARGDRRGPVRDRASLAQDVPGQYLRRPAGDRRPCHERHRPGPLGYQGESPRPTGLEAARGGFRKSLRAYASSLFGATPAETGERAQRFADQGFTAVKFGWDPMGQDRETDVALVREARAGLGPKLDLMIDAGLVYTPRPRFSAPGPSNNSIPSGSRSSSSPTTTKAMPGWPPPPACVSPRARKRANGNRLFS